MKLDQPIISSDIYLSDLNNPLPQDSPYATIASSTYLSPETQASKYPYKGVYEEVLKKLN